MTNSSIIYKQFILQSFLLMYFPKKANLIDITNKNRKRNYHNLNRGILAVNFYTLTFQSRFYIIICHFMILQHNCEEK